MRYRTLRLLAAAALALVVAAYRCAVPDAAVAQAPHYPRVTASAEAAALSGPMGRPEQLEYG